MKKYSEYVSLDISDDGLAVLVNGLSDKLLNEFWPTIPDGPQKDEIKTRLEKNIYSALHVR
jgi:hypothetical protein